MLLGIGMKLYLTAEQSQIASWLGSVAIILIPVMVVSVLSMIVIEDIANRRLQRLK